MMRLGGYRSDCLQGNFVELVSSYGAIQVQQGLEAVWLAVVFPSAADAAARIVVWLREEKVLLEQS